MSDSEEFLSAEEDYDEDQIKTISKKNVISSDLNESKDLDEKTLSKNEKSTNKIPVDEIKSECHLIEKDEPKIKDLEFKKSADTANFEPSDVDNTNILVAFKNKSEKSINDVIHHEPLKPDVKEEIKQIVDEDKTEDTATLINHVKQLSVVDRKVLEILDKSKEPKMSPKTQNEKEIKKSVNDNEQIRMEEPKQGKSKEPKMSSKTQNQKEIKKSENDNEKIKMKEPKQKEVEGKPREEEKKQEIEEKADDSWDFDDWGNDEKDEKDFVKEAQRPVKTEIPKETKANKMEDKKIEYPSECVTEDKGWDDFDDDEEWIAPDEVVKSKEIIKEYNTEPVVQKESADIKCKSGEPTKLKDWQGDVPNSFENLAQSSNNSNTWNQWKPWGGVVTSLLSTATEGVTSLTTHVSQVLENSMGIPEPEELVKINQKLHEQKSKSGERAPPTEDGARENKDDNPFALLGIVSGVTTIGNKVIAGGLDTLEGIGKKTMNILQENDPLLLNKRRIIGLDGASPNLSQVLREAKEKSEEIEKNLKQAQKQSYKKQLHFETLFDHYYGLVHLEALEMLSKQCEIKLQTLMSPLSGKALEEIKETLAEVKEYCVLNDPENDENDDPFSAETLGKELTAATEDFGIATDFSELIECWQKNLDYLQESTDDCQTVFEKGLRCLAETCALEMNRMHKIAELLIIKDSHSTVSEADCLVQITNIFSRHLKGVANKFGAKLNTFEQTEECSTLITNIFVEVYNSITYVQSSFNLFIPILQVGAA